MGLNLIRRGALVWRLEPFSTGMTNARRVGYSSNFPLGTEPYGWYQITVTATGCDGFRLIDKDTAGDPYQEVLAASGLATCSAVMEFKNIGPQILLLGASDKTEVIMHVVPIPPPCFVGFVGGGCLGLEQDSAPGGHRAGRRVASPQGRWLGGASHQRARQCRHGGVAHGIHACDADVYPGVGAVHYVGVHAPRRRRIIRAPHLAGLHGPGVRNHHLPHDVAQGVGC